MGKRLIHVKLSYNNTFTMHAPAWKCLAMLELATLLLNIFMFSHDNIIEAKYNSH